MSDALCDSYCEHGGCCVLDAGHEGLHDSRYCKWSDSQALPKDEADALYIEKGGELAKSMLVVEDTLRGAAQ